MAAAALGAVAGDEAAYNAVLDRYLAAQDESACASLPLSLSPSLPFALSTVVSLSLPLALPSLSFPLLV